MIFSIRSPGLDRRMRTAIDLRKAQPANYDGKEIFEIKPIVVGGSPTDPGNKTALTRAQHIEAVRYWNRVIQQAREKQQSRRNM